MYSIPLGFTFNMGGNTITRFNLLNTNFITTDTTGTISGILATDAQLIDRGALGTVSASPLSYTVSGTPGSRIFKAEWSNAGFALELDNHGTLNDSINMQIWLYEGTNVVELRYGHMHISHPQEYFDMLGQPVIGYVRNLNFMTASIEKIYLLSGNPANPSIDSFSMAQPIATPLSSFPVSGTVYRFTPKSGTTGIGGGLALKGLQVYPTVCSGSLNVSFTDARSVSYNVLAINGTVTTLSGELKSGNNSIDVSSLAPGAYLVRLKDRQQQQVLKFVKE
jgi:hypothetical protein